MLSERFHFTDILIRIKSLRLQRVKTIQNPQADSRLTGQSCRFKRVWNWQYAESDVIYDVRCCSCQEYFNNGSTPAKPCSVWQFNGYIKDIEAFYVTVYTGPSDKIGYWWS